MRGLQALLLITATLTACDRGRFSWKPVPADAASSLGRVQADELSPSAASPDSQTASIPNNVSARAPSSTPSAVNSLDAGLLDDAQPVSEVLARLETARRLQEAFRGDFASRQGEFAADASPSLTSSRPPVDQSSESHLDAAKDAGASLPTAVASTDEATDASTGVPLSSQVASASSIDAGPEPDTSRQDAAAEQQATTSADTDAGLGGDGAPEQTASTSDAGRISSDAGQSPYATASPTDAGFTGIGAGELGFTGQSAGRGFTGTSAGDAGFTGVNAGDWGNTGSGAGDAGFMTAGSGFTGVNAGDAGFTGIGAGSGFTGVNAGDLGFTGIGAGRGFTGVTAEPSATMPNANYYRPIPQYPFFLPWFMMPVLPWMHWANPPDSSQSNTVSETATNPQTLPSTP